MQYEHYFHLVKKNLVTAEITRQFLKEHGLEGYTLDELTEHFAETAKYSGTKIQKPQQKKER